MTRNEEGLVNVVDIGRIGEEAVVNHLTSRGRSEITLSPSPYATDIQARNPHGDLQLFQVKTAVSPFTPTDLSNLEIAAIKARAAKIGASAFAAKAQLSRRYVIQTISYLSL